MDLPTSQLVLMLALPLTSCDPLIPQTTLPQCCSPTLHLLQDRKWHTSVLALGQRPGCRGGAGR